MIEAFAAGRLAEVSTLLEGVEILEARRLDGADARLTASSVIPVTIEFGVDPYSRSDTRQRGLGATPRD